MKKPPEFQISKEQMSDMREALQRYFVDELEVELSNLQADLLIQFLNEKIGRHYYNFGVADAIAAIKERADDLVMLIKN